MPCVGRQYEVTSRPPFKSLLGAWLAPHRGRAVTADDVNGFGVEMTQWRRRTTRRKLDDVLVGFVVAIQITKHALHSIALARPGAHVHGFHVFDVHAADKRRALAFTPLLIHIDTDNCRLSFGIQAIVGCAHCVTSGVIELRICRTYSIAALYVKFRSITFR